MYYMLNIAKILFNNTEARYTASSKKALMCYPSSTREWNNSIYAYNKNSLNSIPNSTILAINIIKSYFLLYNKNLERKIRAKRLKYKFRKLSSNKIFISNGEFKHTNNKVIINLYIFNRQKYNYFLALKKIYLQSILYLGKDLKNKPKIKNKFNSFDMKKKQLVIKKYKCKNLQIWKYKSKTNNILRTEKIKRNIIFKYRSVKPKDIKLFNKKQASFLKSKKINVFHPKNILVKFPLYKPNLVYILFFICFFKIKITSKRVKPNKHLLFSQFVTKLEKIQFKRNNINIVYNDNIVKHRKFNTSFMKKIKAKRKKGLLLLKLINKDKYLVLKNLRKKRNFSFFISIYISKFHKKFVKRCLKKLKRYFYYKQLLYINKSKFNYNYLQFLTKYLYPLYNKNIEYNFINIKHFHLHSDILTESLKLKLTKNKSRMLKKLKGLKDKIGIKNKGFFLFDEVLKEKSIITPNFLKKKSIINKLKYKNFTGFRLEATGRLTRRYTASRSVSKVVYKGNLLDLKSSHKGLPNVLLKGNLESNLQYTKLKSQSRIGSFGLKGWISGN